MAGHPLIPGPAEPAEALSVEAVSAEALSASVRAYAWTGGRTRATRQLGFETLVSTTSRAEELLGVLRSEHQSVALLCRSSTSVAEIVALLSLPLNVVRVLLYDMAGLGLVDVHRSGSGPDQRPGLDLMERVRRGLANLGA